MNASLYGADSAEWDARYYDAAAVIAEEEQRIKDQADEFAARAR